MLAAVTAALLLLVRAASGAAEEAPVGGEAPPPAPGPTLLRKCCGAHEQLSASLDACVAYAGAAGDARAAWEGAGAVAARAGDGGVPWWLNAATPVFDAQTGAAAATARSLLRAQPPHATLRYGPAPPCARSAFKYFTWNSFSRYRLLSNGTLLLRTDDLPSTSAPNLPLPPDLYCADRVDMAGDMHVFYTCPCNKTLCVNKCCPLKQELSVNVSRKHNSFNCVSSSERWKPNFISSNDSNDTVNVQHVLLYPVIPSCSEDEEKVLLNSRPGGAPSALRVLANGSAVLEGFGRGRAFPAQRWCGDFSRVGGNAARVPNALACLRKSARALEAGTVYGSLFLVDAFFLVLTLLVYALLPEMRRSAHAKALMCHVAALLAGSLALAWGQLRTIRSKGECYFIGFFIEYWMLATFFWLTAVCIEIARTFSEMLPANLRGGTEQSKFLWYSLYAWGGPAIITAVAIALEFAEGLPDHIVRPDLGKTSAGGAVRLLLRARDGAAGGEPGAVHLHHGAAGARAPRDGAGGRGGRRPLGRRLHPRRRQGENHPAPEAVPADGADVGAGVRVAQPEAVLLVRDGRDQHAAGRLHLRHLLLQARRAAPRAQAPARLAAQAHVRRGPQRRARAPRHRLHPRRHRHRPAQQRRHVLLVRVLLAEDAQLRVGTRGCRSVTGVSDKDT